MIEPVSDAFTTSIRPACSAKNAMISSAMLPNVALRMPPTRGPVRDPSRSVDRPTTQARPRIAAGRDDEDQVLVGVDPEVQHDRDEACEQGGNERDPGDGRELAEDRQAAPRGAGAGGTATVISASYAGVLARIAAADGPVGIGRLGPAPSHAVRSRGASQPHCGDRGAAHRQAHREGAEERIAGPRRVDRPDLPGLDQRCLAVAWHDECSSLAQRHDHRDLEPFRERTDRVPTSSSGDPSSGWPAISPNSGALGTSQSVTSSSCGSTDAAGAGFSTVTAPIRRAAANPAAVVPCGISNWPMTTSGRKASTASAATSGSTCAVRARDDDDPVGAVGIDPDRRDAGRPRDAAHEGRVDALRRESLQVRGPVPVVPHRVDHRDVGPEPGGHDGLVRTLPAEARLVARPDDRLAVAGQAVRIRDQVDHRAADDDDARRGHHGSSDSATTSRS